MGQKLLLAIGAALVVGALAIGVAGAAFGGWTPAAGFRTGNGPGGPGTMMGGYGPGGMMGGYQMQVPAGAATISIDQAQQAAQTYVSGYGSDLVLDEVIEFQDNFYALVKEKSGTGAFELLVNRVTGAVTPEPGPNLMWNTKYGMTGRGGMMGFFRPGGSMTVSKDRAAQVAQGWLDANQKGAKIEEPDTFHGYYTVHFTKDGQIAGMLSVNGYTGQVWFHTWHGDFIQERQVGG